MRQTVHGAPLNCTFFGFYPPLWRRRIKRKSYILWMNRAFRTENRILYGKKLGLKFWFKHDSLKEYMIFVWWVKIQFREATINLFFFAIWFWKYVISFFLRKILNRMNWADFPMMVKKKSEKLETLGIQMIIQHASICATMILFYLAIIAYKDLRILKFKIWKSKLFATQTHKPLFGESMFEKFIFSIE